VDVDAGAGVGLLGDQTGEEGDAHGVELVGDSVGEDGIHAGVAEDDFIGVLGGGVAVEGGLDVESDEFAYLEEAVKEGVDDGARKIPCSGDWFASALGVSENPRNFVMEDGGGGGNEGAGVVGQRGVVDGFGVEEAGEDEEANGLDEAADSGQIGDSEARGGVVAGWGGEGGGAEAGELGGLD
jgi:hypothetical protein